MNRWDERYELGEMSEKPPEPLLAHAAVPSHTTGRALDVACGVGRHSLWLARNGWRVTAADYSAVALQNLRQSANVLPIDLVLADLEVGSWPFRPATYDLVVDTFFLHRPLFADMRECIKPGGVFFAVLPLAGDDAAEPPFNPDFLVQPGELADLFSDWQTVHYSEGRSAPGRRMRAQIIARKP